MLLDVLIYLTPSSENLSVLHSKTPAFMQLLSVVVIKDTTLLVYNNDAEWNAAK